MNTIVRTKSNAAIIESHELILEAKRLARGDAKDRAESAALLALAKSIREDGLSRDEVRAIQAEHLAAEFKRREPANYRARFDDYVAGKIDDREFRDWLAGTQSDTYTNLAGGGAIVPFAYDDTLRMAMANVDPMLDNDVVDYDMSPAPFLQPTQISGYDLSSIQAALIAEAGQQNPQTVPTVAGGTTASNKIFRVTFASSLEFEVDVPQYVEKIVKASGVALARKVGTSIIAGHGGSDISGIYFQLGNPTQQNTTPGTITLTDITNFFFAVDRFYRNQPKTGWLMSDAAYKIVRAAVDNSSRPLLSVERDGEVLLGKPVYVSPGLGHSSIGSIANGGLIFGDLSYVVVKSSRPAIRRSIEAGQADVTKGEALWTCRMAADAIYFDPSNGQNPPLVLASIR